jgi:hypothetical protein
LLHLTLVASVACEAHGGHSRRAARAARRRDR